MEHQELGCRAEPVMVDALGEASESPVRGADPVLDVSVQRSRSLPPIMMDSAV